MADYNALIEQYKKKLRQSASGTDYSSLYETAADALMNAQNASYESRVQSLNEMLPQIKEDHDQARTDAYENARLSAVRNNETLAALGLAGNLQDEAKSGISETSRITQDNALRRNINELNASQLAQESEVRQNIASAGNENSAEISAILARYAEQLADYKMEADQFEHQKQEDLAEREYKKQVLENDIAKQKYEQEYNQRLFENDIAQQKYEREYNQQLLENDIAKQKYEQEYNQRLLEKDLAEQKSKQEYNLLLFEEEKKQTAIQNAMKEISVFGRIMTQEAADALGLPIGTMSFQVEQKTTKKSTGSTKKSSSKLSEKVQSALDGAKQRMNVETNTYSAAYNASLYGIDVKDLPAYQANQYLNGLVRQHTITEKQAEKVKGILGI